MKRSSLLLLLSASALLCSSQAQEPTANAELKLAWDPPLGGAASLTGYKVYATANMEAPAFTAIQTVSLSAIVEHGDGSRGAIVSVPQTAHMIYVTAFRTITVTQAMSDFLDEHEVGDQITLESARSNVVLYAPKPGVPRENRIVGEAIKFSFDVHINQEGEVAMMSIRPALVTAATE